MSTIAEIRARWQAATQGPWGWKGNLPGKTIELVARVGWGNIVMDFARWGLNGAQPAFVIDGLIRRASGQPGRADRPSMLVAPQSWNAWDIRDIDHPDARFIAASWADMRDLLAEVDRRDAEIARLRAALSGLLGGMDGLCHVLGATTYRGGQHTEAMYQEAIRALVGGRIALVGDGPQREEGEP